ncbi:hypothetical protein B0A52_03669 [Exophiala mesophila]|uniref:Pentatricopeptide repeat domain-containing protein n=1 Tax=Exophiala mesophila TaxID=212818 RepID=A0A438NA49_EXOME|nr:hypothetical protein B0A52_03669 [Exophiala mesophila]
MRGICQLSRRWHQQFCRSPSFSGHQHCLPQFIPVRHYRRVISQPQRSAARKQNAAPSQIGTVTFREFEQSGEDESSRVRIFDPIDTESERMKQELKELDEELAILREGPFGPRSDFMMAFPPNEREEILKALEEEGIRFDEDEDLLSPEDLEEIADAANGRPSRRMSANGLTVSLKIPTKDKVYVKRFNMALEAAEGVTQNARPYLSLWKWYLSCQQNVANFSAILPENVWRFLWKSQYSAINYRPRHLRMLAQDMMKADVDLEEAECLQYLEALETLGDLSTALGMWESLRARLGVNEKFAPEFWMTGVRLYMALGRPQKAQKVAFECYEYTTFIDPEVLVMVLGAWAKTQGKDAEQKTWSCYLELRRRLENVEDDLKMQEILGRVSSTLLQHGRTRLAQAVFKDMFLIIAKSPQDSWKVFQTLAQSQAAAQSPTEGLINKIGLTALADLPRAFHNKYFFASWIKWLLGDDRIDEAGQVLELMYERGIRPDARHVNGLIAAWLREGSPTAINKAVTTGWAMVNARVKMVEKRNGIHEATSNQNEPNKDEKKRLYVERDAPAATVETFSILFLHHIRGNNKKAAAHLTELLLGPAEIKPNSFIVNHWMFGHLRSGKPRLVWDTYLEWKPKVKADLETFAALWDTEKVHLNTPGADPEDFPTPRALFREMMEWHGTLNAKEKAEAQDAFTAMLYDQMIRCVCMSADPAGMLCALYGIRQAFDLLPHEEVNHLLVMQVARSFPSVIDEARVRRKSARTPLRFRGSHYQAVVKALTELIGKITLDKVDKQDLDTDLLEMDEDTAEAQKLRLDVLTSFMCMVLDRKYPGRVHMNDAIREAAEEMKVKIPEEVYSRRDWVDLEA